MEQHIGFMKAALTEAQKAFELGEVPVGAVITKGNEIVSTGYNKRETDKNALMHAEIDAIHKACEALGGWRLWQCNIYITLEPCPMCAGAIINARIPNVFFGAYDYKNGSCGSVTNLFAMPFNHQPSFTGGILQQECSTILTDFFKRLR